MATHRAVAVLSDAIAHLLETRYSPEDFNLNSLEFKVYVASDFATPMDAGVSVFLYRTYINHTNRSHAGRQEGNGERQRPMLPLDLHFLITAWAKDASLQHTIVGWMMRVLEDTPSLPAGLLNFRGVEVFRPTESVELAIAELDTETLFRIWEVIVSNAYQISVPYVARNVRIESAVTHLERTPVQERVLDVQEVLAP